VGVVAQQVMVHGRRLGDADHRPRILHQLDVGQ